MEPREGQRVKVTLEGTLSHTLDGVDDKVEVVIQGKFLTVDLDACKLVLPDFRVGDLVEWKNGCHGAVVRGVIDPPLAWGEKVLSSKGTLPINIGTLGNLSDLVCKPANECVIVERKRER